MRRPAASTIRISGCLRESQIGRRRGGRAENHLHAVLRGQSDVLLQPVELVLALLGLHEGPRELAHVDEFHAELAHVGHVARPLALRPGFGIVIDADGHQIGAGKPIGRGGRSEAGDHKSERQQSAQRFHALDCPWSHATTQAQVGQTIAFRRLSTTRCFPKYGRIPTKSACTPQSRAPKPGVPPPSLPTPPREPSRGTRPASGPCRPPAPSSATPATLPRQAPRR